ncbi:MAG: Flagellar basal body-associated protein FliL [Candidatus Tokpelaia hoelldobleri]|uniref:Flagellar protein FliL n=1 Tax=Candidatus Tokpelaia hoelldobleri TaxID=1902579 RepID=A0A1U9JSW7_9HYPH|nr:MAG: Flagellar basal body-associated protein FliL [Candidatus Tokpelaia hoelldoblerii]
MAADKTSGDKKQGGSDTGGLVIALVILTVLAGGGGWFAGAKLGLFSAVPAGRVNAADKENVAQEQPLAGNNSVIVLQPITTNLASPATTWVRLETSLVATSGEKISPELAAEISNDFLAYMRAVPFSMLKGPTGLMYLREDLLDRARVRSKGRIAHVIISGLVVEEK